MWTAKDTENIYSHACPTIFLFSKYISNINFYRDKDEALDEFLKWLPRLHTVVVGPGLGRNLQILSVVKVLNAL